MKNARTIGRWWKQMLAASEKEPPARKKPRRRRKLPDPREAQIQGALAQIREAQRQILAIQDKQGGSNEAVAKVINTHAQNISEIQAAMKGLEAAIAIVRREVADVAREQKRVEQRMDTGAENIDHLQARVNVISDDLVKLRTKPAELSGF